MHRTSVVKAACGLLSVAAIFSTPVAAQCDPVWLPGKPHSGLMNYQFSGGSFGVRIEGTVDDVTTWDPDGPGPQASTIVAAGVFNSAGSVPVSGIAFWNGERWSPLGTPPGTSTRSTGCVAATPDGRLFRIGRLTPQTPACVVAQWNGSSWINIGESPSGGFGPRLTALHDGTLALSGTFSNMGGIAGPIALWNGAEWRGLDGVAIEGEPTLVSAQNGDWYLAGTVAPAGGTPAHGVLRRTSNGWESVGQWPGGAIRTLRVLGTGELFALRTISASPVLVQEIQIWNGSEWAARGLWPRGLDAIAADPSGDVIAAGTQSIADNVRINQVGRWNGTWSDFDQGFPSRIEITSIASTGEGAFVAAGRDSVTLQPFIARWDGDKWQALGDGFDAPINALELSSVGLVAAGQFNVAGGMLTNRVAVRQDEQWNRMDTGLHGNAYAKGLSLVADPAGGIVVGGAFDWAGSVPARDIARWDGQTWHAYGPGVNNHHYASEFLPDGSLVVLGSGGGGFQMQRWNGNAWIATGNGLTGGGGSVVDLLTTRDGGLFATGAFESPGLHVASWNGSAWMPMQGGLSNTVSPFLVGVALLELPSGDVVAGGLISMAGNTPVGGLARWDGSAWHAFAPGVEFAGALELLPSGDVLSAAAALLPDGTRTKGIGRWDGQRWWPLGTGVAGGGINTIQSLPNGDVAVAGDFLTAGGQPSAFFAVWGSPCRCPADLDNDGIVDNGGTRDGAVTIDDLLYFLPVFEEGLAVADLDNDGEPTTGSPDGAVTIDDLLFFIARFEQGC